MQEVDPPVQINPDVQATLEAARIQVEATIRAAEIGAQATRDAAIRAAEIGAKAATDAADLQLDAAIIAAVAALIAGCLAYFAAIHAAKTQTAIEKEKYNTRISAYSIRQTALIGQVIEDIQYEKSAIDSMVKYLIDEKNAKIKDYNAGMDMLISLSEEPNDWKDENWESHALLGRNFINSLANSKEKLNILNNVKVSLMEYSKFACRGEEKLFEDHYRFKDIVLKNGDGSSRILFNAVENLEKYRKILLDFEISLKDLVIVARDSDSGTVR